MLADASFIGFIPVRDLAAARAFYAGTLGLRVVDDTPFALVLDAGGTMLRLTPVPELAARPSRLPGGSCPTSAPGYQVAWFKDREGNTLSLTAFAVP